MVVGCWVMAFLLGSAPLLGWSESANNNITNSTCQFMNVMSMSYMVFFNFLGCILIPMLCTGALYAYIFYQIRKRLQNRDAESSAYYHQERSLACSLLLVLLLFVLCWLPIHLINIAHYAGKVVPKPVVYIGILLSHANSALNPVVYTFKVPKIQKAYREIWRRSIQGCGNQKPSNSSQGNLTPCSNPVKLQNSKDLSDDVTEL